MEEVTTQVPTGELTIESYNYYKNEIYGSPVNTIFTKEQTQFTNVFLTNVSKSALPPELYNAIVEDKGECLEILMLSNDLTKQQISFLHMQLRTANKGKYNALALRKLLKNETYQIDPSFLIALVFIVKEKCGPNTPVFEGLLIDIVDLRFKVKNETLVSIFYGGDNHLSKDPVLMSNLKIVLPLLERLAKGYKNIK